MDYCPPNATLSGVLHGIVHRCFLDTVTGYYHQNIRIYTLLVCLYPVNVKTTKTIVANFFCGNSHDPRKGLWMIKISKINLKQNSIELSFENPHIFFYKICELL